MLRMGAQQSLQGVDASHGTASGISKWDWLELGVTLGIGPKLMERIIWNGDRDPCAQGPLASHQIRKPVLDAPKQIGRWSNVEKFHVGRSG
jgi:hypothetical protein